MTTPTYILGIHNSYDSGAALFKNGVCIFAINEERLSRVKMDDSFPNRSIDACLAFAGITEQDVDVVSYAWHSGFVEAQLPGYVARALEIAQEGPEAKRIMLERTAVEVERSAPRKKDFEKEMIKRGWQNKVEWFDHHAGHAATAFYPSPFTKALVITLDAAGNYRSGSVSVGDGAELKELACSYTWDSLGFFYGQITELLGFKPHRHEGKVTGLAAYGDPKKCLPIMQEMLTTKDGKLYGKIGKYYKPFFYQQTDALKEALKGHSREDIAAAVQQHFEDVITDYIRYWIEKTGVGTLALSGGAFANVKLNQRVRAIPGVVDQFVFPHMGDGGLSVGACLLSLARRGVRSAPWKHVYLGSESTETEIETALQKYSQRISVEKLQPKDVAQRAVELLKQNKVLGLFQGRMEYGPRALGNRSIIYHAKDKTANDWLNKRMHRTEFMPFAPVTTMELAPRCFKGWDPTHVTTRFMTECYDCTTEMKQNSPAVVHVDGTARPQIIAREDNPLYFDIVDAWYRETGGLCLINTSFNEHEHPIVCTIEDALQSFLDDTVDYLIVQGHYVISHA
ncbi:MAG: carbamoyltransferase C-terminal domain-containing protein [bacterium]|nr:carbamoyltransferase C-terminal domain-containing protein [bacterium]